MMIRHISMAEADGHLAELIEAVQRGDEIIIEDAGQAPVKLILATPARIPRKLGIYRGKIRLREDFNEPLPQNFLLNSPQ
jgi:antitoxin (DNA-binding transcriptional repressor) of toxin-antitoxin stability system